MRYLLCLLVLYSVGVAQQSTRITQTAKTKATIGNAFARAGLKTLYEIRDGGNDEVVEALQNTEIESDQSISETTMLKNLQNFYSNLSDLHETELYVFQYALTHQTPKQPTGRILKAMECYRILEASFRSRTATPWPEQCNLKPQ